MSTIDGSAVRTVGVDSHGHCEVGDVVREVRQVRDLGGRAIVVLTAGTADRGQVDPIGEIAGYCDPELDWIHVDAAFGACLIPFVKEWRERFPFDFRLEPVRSIVLDLHKSGGCPMPSGVFMLKECPKWNVFSASDVGYLRSIGERATLCGSFPASSAYMAYAVIATRGVDGFEKRATHCLQLRERLRAHIDEMDRVSEVCIPDLSILLLDVEGDCQALYHALLSAGFFVELSEGGIGKLCIRIGLNPHNTARAIDGLAKGIREGCAEQGC